MKRVYICSPYRGDTKKNLKNAIRHCRMADAKGMLPIAPHVYFTRVFPEEGWRDRTTGMLWGKDLMQYCTEIWIFCNELTEGMIEEIATAKKLGLMMKFYDVSEEEINSENHLKFTELGPAYRKLIAESNGDRFHLEGGHGDFSTCRSSSGDDDGEEDDSGESGDCKEPRGLFNWIFNRK